MIRTHHLQEAILSFCDIALIKPARILQCLRWGLFLLFLPAFTISHAASISVTQAAIEKVDNTYRIQTGYQIDLNQHLKDVLMHGVPLYFTEDLIITRERWYWFDKSIVDAHRTTRIAYNVLTDQYHVATDGLLQRSFDSLQQALDVITHPARWSVDDSSVLESNVPYQISVKLALDVSKLPKPFQVNAINDRDWNLSSPKKQFIFTPE